MHKSDIRLFCTTAGDKSGTSKSGLTNILGSIRTEAASSRKGRHRSDSHKLWVARSTRSKNNSLKMKRLRP